MIDSKNIQAYINFLHFKKYLLPATQVLLEKWASLSDAEVRQNIDALYTHWGIANETAAAYELEFITSSTKQDVSIPSEAVAILAVHNDEPVVTENSIPKNNTRKYAVMGICLLLIIAAIFWFNKKEEPTGPPSETALEQELKQAQETISQEQLIRDQRDSLQQVAKQKQLEKVQDFKANRNKYVQQSVSYDYDKMFGGIKKVAITVNNKSDFKLNEVVVQLQYIKKNGEVYESQKVSVYNVQPHKTATVAGPSSKRGTKMSSTIISVQSDELEESIK